MHCDLFGKSVGLSPPMSNVNKRHATGPYLYITRSAVNSDKHFVKFLFG